MSKTEITQRIRLARSRVFGEDLGRVAALVGVPEGTWRNYEAGVTIPGDVLLAFLVASGVHPGWLLDGRREMLRE